VLIVSVPLAGDGTDAASFGALGTLRSRVLPDTVPAGPPAAHGAGPGSGAAESGHRSRRPFGIKGNGGGAARGFWRGAPPKADNRNMPFAR
jgi:hypothetical protein